MLEKKHQIEWTLDGLSVGGIFAQDSPERLDRSHVTVLEAERTSRTFLRLPYDWKTSCAGTSTRTARRINTTGWLSSRLRPAQASTDGTMIWSSPSRPDLPPSEKRIGRPEGRDGQGRRDGARTSASAGKATYLLHPPASSPSSTPKSLYATKPSYRKPSSTLFWGGRDGARLLLIIVHLIVFRLCGRTVSGLGTGPRPAGNAGTTAIPTYQTPSN
ncbi:hypothetical protein BT69DRAFT_1331442 [Atractiella rhizophila]|nr:hypothetical protein BT69DRAFT_1331442 [Atractiella rhizophila]